MSKTFKRRAAQATKSNPTPKRSFSTATTHPLLYLDSNHPRNSHSRQQRRKPPHRSNTPQPASSHIASSKEVIASEQRSDPGRSVGRDVQDSIWENGKDTEMTSVLGATESRAATRRLQPGRRADRQSPWHARAVGTLQPQEGAP